MKEGCTVQTCEAYLVVAMVLQNAGNITKSSQTVKVTQQYKKE